MARVKPVGGRHASVGSDRYIQLAAKDFIASYPGARIRFGRVLAMVSKAEVPGTWKLRRSTKFADGGLAILLFSDSCTVQARAYLSVKPVLGVSETRPHHLGVGATESLSRADRPDPAITAAARVRVVRS